MTMLPVSLIEPDQRNIRAGTGDPDALRELADSIRRTGLIHSIRVYPIGGGRYRIQAGHRRFAAVQLLGETQISVEECDPPIDDLARLDGMFAENFHREALNPMEEARGLRLYADQDLSQEQIASRVGRPQSHISTSLMFLTELTDAEQQMLESGQLTRTAAVDLMKRRRAEQGRARSDAGRRHRYGYSVPWFNGHHPHAGTAQQRCRGLDHSPVLRIGPACGPCWEHVITAAATHTQPARPSAPAALVDRAVHAERATSETAGQPRRTPDRPTTPPAPPRTAPTPPPAKFGDIHRPSRADTPEPPSAAPEPRPAPAPLSAATLRACGCLIPPEISDAVAARNSRVHEDGCDVADTIEFDRLSGHSSR